jgi:hypothetical protein
MSGMMGGDASSIGPAKSTFYADPSGRASPAPAYGRGSPAPSVYERYMSRGPIQQHHPHASSEIELARMDATAVDQLPLLQQGYYDGAPQRPTSSQYFQQPPPPPPPGMRPPSRMSPQGQYPPAGPVMYGDAPIAMNRPQLHQQQSSFSLQSRQAPSSYSTHPHSRTPSAYSQGGEPQNMAGRGTYR